MRMMPFWSVNGMKLISQTSISYFIWSFNIILGLRIDYSKSVLYGISVPQNDMVVVAALVLECKISEFPFKYLWLMVGVNMNRVNNWTPKMPSIIGSLNGKKRVLIHRWWVILSKSILEAIPTYFFHCIQPHRKLLTSFTSFIV